MESILLILIYPLAYLPNIIIDGIVQLLTFILYDLFHMREKVISNNIEICFGEELTQQEKSAIARGAWKNLLRTALEFLRLVRFSKSYVNQNFSFKGTHHIDEAKAKGKGIIFLTLHIGNWELMGAAVNTTIIKTMNLAKPLNPPWFDRLVIKLRSKGNLYVTPVGAKSEMPAVQVLRGLKDNKCVGFLFDQYRPGDIEVPFFGVNTRTNSALADFAAKTGASVIPAYCLRNEDNTFKVTFLEPIDCDFSGSRPQNRIKNTTAFNQVLEQIIRKHPHQWLWMHKRFR